MRHRVKLTAMKSIVNRLTMFRIYIRYLQLLSLQQSYYICVLNYSHTCFFLIMRTRVREVVTPTLNVNESFPLVHEAIV